MAEMKHALVALHGAPGAGKDTIALHLSTMAGARLFAFADSLYSTLAGALGVHESMLRDRKNKETPTDRLSIINVEDKDYRYFLAYQLLEDIYTPRTSRYHLQKYGTEFMRHLDIPSVWVEETCKAIFAVPSATPVVVSDVRAYKDRDEVAGLRALCTATGRQLYVIRIVRDGAAPGDHESDASLPNHLVDYTIHNREGRSFEAAQELCNLVTGAQILRNGGING